MQEEIKPCFVMALPEDLDEICALCRLVGRSTDTSGWNDEYPSRQLLAKDIENKCLYKSVHQGKIISIMLFQPWADYVAGDEADDIKTWDPEIKNPCALARFCVSPLFQGQGLGRKMMLASLAKAKEMGYDGVFFHADKADPVATHIYDKIGFHRADEIFEYGIHFICYEMKF